MMPYLRKFPFIESDFRKPWQDFLLINAAGLCIGKGRFLRWPTSSPESSRIRPYNSQLFASVWTSATCWIGKCRDEASMEEHTTRYDAVPFATNAA